MKKTNEKEIIVVKKKDFITAMNNFKDNLAVQKTLFECQEKSKLKLIELTDALMKKDIYDGDYVDQEKLRGKRQALYRICERIGTCFYKTEHMSSLSFFVLIFLGVPYLSFEAVKEKSDQPTFFDVLK